MKYYLHGTPMVNLPSILRRSLEDKPGSAWSCSDGDGYFYMWNLGDGLDVDAYDLDSAEIKAFVNNLHNKSLDKLELSTGSEAIWAGLTQLASAPEKYLSASNIAVLLLSHDSEVDDLIEPDLSCDQDMENASRILLSNLKHMNIVGYWSISTSVFALPMVAAILQSQPYFSFNSTDPHVIQLVDMFVKKEVDFSDLWDLVDEWKYSGRFVWLD